jgi:3-phosphoshikimate 1-carboxyvinyltransferase
MDVKLTYCDFLRGEITPVSSKSLSNRALIIHALTGHACKLNNLSESEDTITLISLLEKIDRTNGVVELNTGPAGTVMRFLAAYCCLTGKEIMLTGSERMQQRPMVVLVDALLALGAKIEYMGKPGFAPLRILPQVIKGGKVNLPANISSQFISSLLLCAPYFDQGIEIELKGHVVSSSYIHLTLEVMKEFGAEVEWKENTLRVSTGKYLAREFNIEGDWSSASYFFSWVALSKNALIHLNGMNLSSTQGDKAIVKAAEKFGVKTVSTHAGILLEKVKTTLPDKFEMNFNECPDIAQTLAVMCAGNGLQDVKLTGLQTLSLKETDRILALKTELDRFSMTNVVAETSLFSFDASTFYPYKGLIHTYDDHRMAMGFAPMVQKTGELIIQNGGVVKKSYINYWQDLKSLGCIIENSDI